MCTYVCLCVRVHGNVCCVHLHVRTRAGSGQPRGLGLWLPSSTRPAPVPAAPCGHASSPRCPAHGRLALPVIPPYAAFILPVVSFFVFCGPQYFSKRFNCDKINIKFAILTISECPVQGCQAPSHCCVTVTTAPLQDFPPPPLSLCPQDTLAPTRPQPHSLPPVAMTVTPPGPPTRRGTKAVSCCVWLMSLSPTSSRLIPVIAGGSVSFLFKAK